MEVQQEILDKLKCSECTGYLSSAPVLLTAGGQSVCGRCPAPEEEPAARNRPYELLAQHVAFPCKYQEEGCLKKLAFGQLQAHEDGCGYRKYLCPVVATGACEWLGSRGEILEHCSVEHPDSVIENSHLFRHNITTSSVHAYIMIAFNMLFLVHTKVCTTARKIYHSVRLLGHPEHAACFNFKVYVERDDSRLTRKGQVVAQGCLYIKEDISLQIGINSLLDILGGYDGTTFKLIVNQMSQLHETPAKEILVVECVKCGACVSNPAYRDVAGWCCEACTPPRRPCQYSSKGCTHTDIDCKARIHEAWYCEHSSALCGKCHEVPGGSMTAHCVSQHPEVVRKAGTAWRHSRADNGEIRYVPSEVGILFYCCWATPRSSEFVLHVYSPLPREELRLYECVVVLEHPATGHTQRFTPTAEYDTVTDWKIKIKDKNIRQVFQGLETNIKLYVVEKNQKNN